jgi:hypothetical protein
VHRSKDCFSSVDRLLHSKLAVRCKTFGLEIDNLCRQLILELLMSISSRLGILALLLVMAVGTLCMPDSAAAQDRRVRVVNASNATVNSFYASNTKRGSWEEDILGRSVLAPGQSVMINIDDGSGACMYDFKAVLATGRAIETYGMDVCRISSWTIR